MLLLCNLDWCPGSVVNKSTPNGLCALLFGAPLHRFIIALSALTLALGAPTSSGLQRREL